MFKTYYRMKYLCNPRTWIERNKNRKLLQNARNNHKNNPHNKNPLISVLIATYNRANILAERTIPSVLRQTYQNFEIVVVGDHCTDNTADLLKSLNDQRIKFTNLPQRGVYPENPDSRWRVAGVVPRNKAIDLCSGEWIATLDDDDEFTSDHLEILLNFALENNLEMVYGKVKMEKLLNQWIELGSAHLKEGNICHLSALYHSNFKFLKYDINCWKYKFPADWFFWNKIRESGGRIGFIDKIVGKHYLEGTQMRSS